MKESKVEIYCNLQAKNINVAGYHIDVSGHHID